MDLFIAGVGVFLPPLVGVRDAVADGRCGVKQADRTAMVSVAVSTGESAPDMAAEAGKRALRHSGHRAEDIAVLLHADCYDQGLDFWPTAAYVQHLALGATDTTPIQVRQMCTGAMACIELGAAYLGASSDRVAALLTTGEKFSEPGFDRWRSDPGMLFGDGAAALVLSRRGGFARISGLATHTDTRMEPLYRGAETLNVPIPHRAYPVDLTVRKRAFVERVGIDAVQDAFHAGLLRTVGEALDAAGTTVADIDRFVVPHVGRRIFDGDYLKVLGIDETRTTWSWGSRVGHLGAGDQFAGFDHLVRTGALRRGDRCLLIGVGAGFSWASAVVEMVADPPAVPEPGGAL